MVHDTTLSGWMQTLVGYVRSGKPDLTNRQMALLLLVYLTTGPHTVRGLAQSLGVSKPVVTRALNTLGALGYLRRERDEADRRNIFIAHTDIGAKFLEGFGELIDGDDAPGPGRHLKRAVA
ncbi:MarR family transcriptional regulator [Sphingomonas bacterium]|uniref:MarR family transcriptional regulator n=1 Tax=Sphingomonas bacterium TaxID=1895847 RepID=UPI0020C71406|nr:MarR family transcriptional regulator [Sphingomonas bacterium]